MLKSNKGYFLAEAIIAITIVSIAITTLYVNSTSSYIKQKNEITKFNTIDGLYYIREVKKYYNNQESTFKSNISSSTGYFLVFNSTYDNSTIKPFFDELNISKIYFTTYDISLFLENISVPASIKGDLKSLKYDKNLCQYRYIVTFNDDSYSTIGVDCYE